MIASNARWKRQCVWTRRRNDAYGDIEGPGIPGAAWLHTAARTLMVGAHPATPLRAQCACQAGGGDDDA